jgi:hypothetical protein
LHKACQSPTEETRSATQSGSNRQKIAERGFAKRGIPRVAIALRNCDNPAIMAAALATPLRVIGLHCA